MTKSGLPHARHRNTLARDDGVYRESRRVRAQQKKNSARRRNCVPRQGRKTSFPRSALSPCRAVFREHRIVFFKGAWYEAVKNTALQSWNAVGLFFLKKKKEGEHLPLFFFFFF